MYVASNGNSDRVNADEEDRRRSDESRQRDRATHLAADLRSATILQSLLKQRVPRVGFQPSGTPLQAKLQAERASPAQPNESTRTPSASELERQRSLKPALTEGTQTDLPRRPEQNEQDPIRRSAREPVGEILREVIPSGPGSQHLGSSSPGAPVRIRARGLSADVIDSIVRTCRVDHTAAGQLRMRIDFDLGSSDGFSMDVVSRGERSVALLFRGRNVPLRAEEIDRIVQRLAAQGVRVVEATLQAS
jgi:hypothetical protein